MPLFTEWNTVAQKHFDAFYQNFQPDGPASPAMLKFELFKLICEWFADFVYYDGLDLLVSEKREQDNRFKIFHRQIKNLQSAQDALNIPDQFEARLEVLHKYLVQANRDFESALPTGISFLPNFDSLTKVDFTSFASELDVTNQDLSVIHFLFKSGLVKPTLLISEAVQNGSIKIEDKGHKTLVSDLPDTCDTVRALNTLEAPTAVLLFSLAHKWFNNKEQMQGIIKALKIAKKYTSEKDLLPWYDFLFQHKIKIGSFITLVLALLAFIVKMYVI